METKDFLSSYAIFEFGGKQHQAVVGTTLSLEKIDAEAGSNVSFEKVLLVKKNDSEILIGTPYVGGAKIAGEILTQIKGPKLIAFRFHRRKRIRVKKGHRQQLTIVRVTEISA